MIYNIDDDDIFKNLKNIINVFVNNDDYISLIHELVGKSDGDFIIYAYNPLNKSGFLFNDFLGRLPMYYHQSDNLISLCSEIKGVLHNIPKIVINKLELMNSLVFLILV